LKPETRAALEALLTKYRRRAEKNKRAFKVEVHIPIGDLLAIIAVASTGLDAIDRLQLEEARR